MPEEKQNSRPPLKVTDKRLFTAEGEIREEFREDVTSVEPAPPAPEPRPEVPPPPEPPRKQRDPLVNPGTPFSNFIETLVLNGYVSLGLVRSPYQPEPILDLPAARQMIDMIGMLAEKTKGNLTADETDFMEQHLGDLKLKYVQRNRGAIG